MATSSDRNGRKARERALGAGNAADSPPLHSGSRRESRPKTLFRRIPSNGWFGVYLWTIQRRSGCHSKSKSVWRGATCVPRARRVVCAVAAGRAGVGRPPSRPARPRPQRLHCGGFLGGGRLAGDKWALAAPCACIVGVFRTAAAPLPRLCSWVCPRPTAWRRPRRLEARRAGCLPLPPPPGRGERGARPSSDRPWATPLAGCWRPCLGTKRPASSSWAWTYVPDLS